MGVQVPEELTKLRENLDGSIRRMSCQEHLQNPYTPNYRYQDWVSRPLTEIVREIEANHTLYCHLPPAPTQYWDFYNEVRMGRPAKKSAPEVEYRECRVIPIPAYKDIPDVVPSGATNHYGNHSKYQMSLPPFYDPEASQPCQFKK
ncbi:uncharacterized protein LOC131933407 [Physella acuta]|uniref:uncharacterized protein LOC131933407 n=1 Tax=Physella acuta TaxID=109671 RepID=UPI0027DAD491|nr:uncharacterized protein LOC131933407 [Physella acuta]